MAGVVRLAGAASIQDIHGGVIMLYRYLSLVRRLAVVWVLLAGPGQPLQAQTVAAAAAESPRVFRAADFKWPVLIESLHNGTLESAVNADEAVFILYYLQSLNEVFGDSEMKVFLSAQCFTDLHDAEMEARLQSMFWLRILPQAMGDLGGVLSEKNTSLSDSMARRYPMLANITRDLSRDVSTGAFDRLFILGNLPKILKTKAHQDALILFTNYGCSSEVTTRVYKNAVNFVKARAAAANN